LYQVGDLFELNIKLWCQKVKDWNIIFRTAKYREDTVCAMLQKLRSCSLWQRVIPMFWSRGKQCSRNPGVPLVIFKALARTFPLQLTSK